MHYPNDFTDEMRKQGICGVLAIAAASSVTMAQAHKACAANIMPHQKRHVRATYDDQIFAAIRSFGRTVTEVPVTRQNLRSWISLNAEMGQTYLVFVSGHVMLVRDEYVMDQVDLAFFEAHPARRRFVTRVMKVD